MKSHIGADDVTGLVPSQVNTSANVHDVVQADKLLHADDAKRIPEHELMRKWLKKYPGWSEKMIDSIPGTWNLERFRVTKMHFSVL